MKIIEKGRIITKSWSSFDKSRKSGSFYVRMKMQANKIKNRGERMKKLLMKYSGILAAMALVFTTLTANSTCTWVTYQEKLPKAAKKLRKF